MSILDTTASVQDQILDAITTGEESVVSAVKTVVDAIEPLTSMVPEAPFADQVPSATEVIDLWFGFAQKLLANQKDFALKLADLGTATTPPATAKKTTARKAA